MERADLLAANAQIFTAQGKALNAVASRNVKVLVVGNPANTNAYIAMKSAPDLPAKNFTAMLRLDHNRAASQIAAKTGGKVGEIEKLTVWGNHSPTMYADYRFATIGGKSVKDAINDQVWNADVFLPTVGKRGAAIIEARAACPPPPRPPTPPSTTCATGPWARTASGSLWACPPRASTAFPKASCSASR